jgi:membrane-associated phospholipid phosphatase
MKLGRVVAIAAHPITLVAASALTVLAARGHRGTNAARFGIALSSSVLVSKALKRVVRRRKPRLFSLTRHESFPSGHATATTAFGLTLAKVIDPRIALPLAAGLVALVDACRVHDREHRIREVLVGNALGAAGAVLAAIIAP